MTLKKVQPIQPCSALKSSSSSSTKHTSDAKLSLRTGGVVRFAMPSSSPSKEVGIMGDSCLQSSDKRRRYMRRGSRSPNMMWAIHAVRASVEVAELEAYDDQQVQQSHKQLDYESPLKASSSKDLHQQRRPSLVQMAAYSLQSRSPMTTTRTTNIPPKELVNGDLARSLFHKTNIMTPGQRRRLSLEILSRVSAETSTATM